MAGAVMEARGAIVSLLSTRGRVASTAGFSAAEDWTELDMAELDATELDATELDMAELVGTETIVSGVDVKDWVEVGIEGIAVETAERSLAEGFDRGGWAVGAGVSTIR